MKKKLLPLIIIGVVAFGIWRYIQQKNFRYAGTIEATEVDLSPQVTGVIDSITVKEGDPVQAGQTVLSIKGEDYKLALDQAEREYKRAVNLHASGSMPDESFERLRTRRDEAQLRVSWCTIKSPLTGVVLDRYHEPGELVGPSMKLLTLADVNQMWAHYFVPQPLLAKLSLGMKVTGTLPELKDKKFEGTITSIRDEAEFTPKNVQTREERTRLVYAVKITFDNAEKILKPGMTVEVALPE